MSLAAWILQQSRQNAADEELIKNRQMSSKLDNLFLEKVEAIADKGQLPDFLQNQIDKIRETHGTLNWQRLFDSTKHDLYQQAKSAEDILNATERSAKKIEMFQTGKSIADFLHLPEVKEFVGQNNLVKQKWQRDIGVIDLQDEIDKVIEASRGNLLPKVARGFR